MHTESIQMGFECKPLKDITAYITGGQLKLNVTVYSHTFLLTYDVASHIRPLPTTYIFMLYLCLDCHACDYFLLNMISFTLVSYIVILTT